MAFKTKLTMKFLTKIKANLTMTNHNHIQNKTHVETKNEIQIGIHTKFLTNVKKHAMKIKTKFKTKMEKNKQCNSKQNYNEIQNKLTKFNNF